MSGLDVQVKAKWSKNLDQMDRAILSDVLTMQRVLATAIRQRVAAGRTATPPEPYSTTPTAGPKGKARYYVSPAYATALGLGNQTRWESSAAMHSANGIKAGSARATGRMWDGLQVRNFGRSAALIEFGGSSMGASSTLTAITKRKTGTYQVTVSGNGKIRARQARELSRDEGGKVQYRRKPKLVRNSLKAAAVYQNTGVGLLQNTPGELMALQSAWCQLAGQELARLFGGRVESVRATGDATLYAMLIRELTR